MKLKYLKQTLNHNDIYNLCAPSLRWQVIILYFWAVIQKLNYDFFDTAVGCTTREMFNLKDKLAFFPTYDLLLIIGPYATLIVETLIPVLLIFHRGRIWGVLLGVLFHFMLGFSYTKFSAFVYCLYVLFLPNGMYTWIFTKIKNNWFIKSIHQLRAKHHMIAKFGISVVVLCLAVWIFAQLFIVTGKWWLQKNRALYLCYSLVVIALLLWEIVKEKNWQQPIVGNYMSFANKWYIIFPVIVFVNGLLPHLGVKNTQVFAMFSNLRTEQATSNHFFIPASWQISHNLSDVVTIIQSNDPVLKHFQQKIPGHGWNSTFIVVPKTYTKQYPNTESAWRFELPFLMLRARITQLHSAGARNVYVKYKRNGEVFEVRNAENDPTLNNLPWLARKFLLLRAVPRSSKGQCMW